MDYMNYSYSQWFQKRAKLGAHFHEIKQSSVFLMHLFFIIIMFYYILVHPGIQHPLEAQIFPSITTWH